MVFSIELGDRNKQSCTTSLLKNISMKLKSSIYSLFHFLSVLPILSLATSDLINSDKQALLDFASATVIHTKRLNWNDSTLVCSSWIGITCDINQTRVVGIHLPGIGLVGSIPFNSLGKLDALKVLSLRSNLLNGNLPSDIPSIPSLQYLYLQNNNFSGLLPSSLSHKLIVLDLSYNSISGNIPTSIQNLTRLTVLKLQNNSISGTIPNFKLPSLNFLNLSYNNLNGSVPYSFKKFPNSSFAGNSLLCGQPLRNCSTTLSSPSPSSSPISTGHIYSSSNKKLGKNSVIALAIVGSAVLFFVVVVAFICCIKRRKAKGSVMFKGKASANGKNEKPPDFGSGVQEAEKNKLFFFPGCSFGFDLEDLLRASAEILGKGSGGTTYKAVMEDGTTVVVKRLKEVVVGKKEFEQQMEVLGKIGQHPNIAPLRAYYYSKDEKLIVYNYMPFGSLFVRLHGNRDSGRNPLDWDARLKIIIGTAKGIAHIHSEGGAKFIHGNIKSSNVLLTQDLEACISDVGLASLMNYPPTMSRSLGYRAPEAYETRKITQKSDVYSFGVLLLEMLTGKSPLQYPGHDYVVDLPRWVRSVVREEWTAEVFDVEVLRGQYVEEEMVQMLQIALACVSKLPDTRPNMDQVVKMIEETRPSDSKARPSSESETSNLQTP